MRVKASRLMQGYDGRQARFRFAYSDPVKDSGVSKSMETRQVVEESASKVFYKVFEKGCLEADGSRRGLFVDLGVHFGWFTVLAAAMGYRVIAVHVNNLLQHL